MASVDRMIFRYPNYKEQLKTMEELKGVIWGSNSVSEVKWPLDALQLPLALKALETSFDLSLSRLQNPKVSIPLNPKGTSIFSLKVGIALQCYSSFSSSSFFFFFSFFYLRCCQYSKHYNAMPLNVLKSRESRYALLSIETLWEDFL